MADKLDRSLDEILGEKKSSGPRNQNSSNNNNNRRGGAPRRRERERQEYPRDGVRKSFRDEPRNLDSEWVHDRFEEHDSRRGPKNRRRRDSPEQRDSSSAKLRVENVHYELTAEDLEELFNRIGPVVKLDLKYDRAGRSEGVAYVTMSSREDAQEAIKEFDGANANGQPIKLSFTGGHGGRSSRNPFDSAVMPSRPLSERISAPGGRSRSMSPGRKYDVDDAASKGIDRYVPGTRSRSPMPRRRGAGGGGGGRRPGARREGQRDQEGGRGGGGGGGGRSNGRTRKTQEELDAEMADYFGGGNSGETAPEANGGANAAAAAAAAVPTDDIDMIE